MLRRINHALHRGLVWLAGREERRVGPKLGAKIPAQGKFMRGVAVSIILSMGLSACGGGITPRYDQFDIEEYPLEREEMLGDIHYPPARAFRVGGLKRFRGKLRTSRFEGSLPVYLLADIEIEVDFADAQETTPDSFRAPIREGRIYNVGETSLDESFSANFEGELEITQGAVYFSTPPVDDGSRPEATIRFTARGPLDQESPISNERLGETYFKFTGDGPVRQGFYSGLHPMTSVGTIKMRMSASPIDPFVAGFHDPAWSFFLSTDYLRGG